ncbi:hypothetical protein HOLleu_33307 [Holothuria leucospilota]|uniref:Uncharacterized protein n=1 Tax=Holothuria leucospilota TaxID=206669 RepID=A0A9Q1BGH9_HOLLE|nr:hypothetical protein HOLleu_33307 [Holothuria leucospilota]
MEQPTRIFLWCWPRTISTALEKCMSFVDGMQTWHEPYTVAYGTNVMTNLAMSSEQNAISHTVLRYFEMMAETDENSHLAGGNLMSTPLFTYSFVKDKLEEYEPGKKYIFIKDMASAIAGHYDDLPDKQVPTRHTFLIRHPYRFLTSQRRLLLRLGEYKGDPRDFDMLSASPLISESYFREDWMYQLWKYVQDTGKDPNPVVIDAEDLMNNPEVILPEYMAALGIPFQKRYLTWDASEDSLKDWKGALEHMLIGKEVGLFDRAFKSSRFLPSLHPTPSKQDLTPDILKVADVILPGYEAMFCHRIRPIKLQARL